MDPHELYLGGADDGAGAPANPQTPDGFQGLHKWLYRGAIFFFVSLAVDGFIIFPLVLIKYGWH